MKNRTGTALGLAIAMLVAVMPLLGCTQSALTAADGLQGNSGVVYLSLTRSGSVETSMWLRLRGVNNGYNKLVAVDDAGVGLDWKKLSMPVPTYSNSVARATKDEPVGYVAALALPPGDYEFTDWYGASPVWGRSGDDYHILSQDFSVKFTVKPGEVTYAGNLQVMVPNAIFPDNHRGNFEIAVSDQHGRDAAVFKQKYPKLAGMPEAVALMSSANAGQQLTYYTFSTTGPTRNGGGSFN